MRYFKKSGTFPKIGYIQIERNTVFPGYAPEPSDWRVVVTTKGIVCNGNCGTNPPADEIAEMTEVIMECARAYSNLQEKKR